MSDDKRFERMELKLDDISDHMGMIDVTLAAQNITLQEHVRRTSLLEEEFQPIRRKVYMAQGAVGFIALLSIILGIMAYFTHK